jgi:hypothetical protein
VFEVNCGNQDPDATAPLDGTVLEYVIINMPESPTGQNVSRPLPPADISQRIEMANQTQSSP